MSELIQIYTSRVEAHHSEDSQPVRLRSIEVLIQGVDDDGFFERNQQNLFDVCKYARKTIARTGERCSKIEIVFDDQDNTKAVFVFKSKLEG